MLVVTLAGDRIRAMTRFDNSVIATAERRRLT
jgi:hypothetical protein